MGLLYVLTFENVVFYHRSLSRDRRALILFGSFMAINSTTTNQSANMSEGLNNKNYKVVWQKA